MVMLQIRHMARQAAVLDLSTEAKGDERKLGPEGILSGFRG